MLFLVLAFSLHSSLLETISSYGHLLHGTLLVYILVSPTTWIPYPCISYTCIIITRVLYALHIFATWIHLYTGYDCFSIPVACIIAPDICILVLLLHDCLIQYSIVPFFNTDIDVTNIVAETYR